MSRNMVVTCMPLIVLCGTVIDGDSVKTDPPEPKSRALWHGHLSKMAARFKVWRVNWVNKDAFAVFTLADIGLFITTHGPCLLCACLIDPFFRV